MLTKAEPDSFKIIKNGSLSEKSNLKSKANENQSWKPGMKSFKEKSVPYLSQKSLILERRLCLA